ncbi:MAG: biopolymer transporter ExbD [Verrucomicrobia bacterium]|nr:biopolymer transporter ExbD [Verrucomicrobiota bacterium]
MLTGRQDNDEDEGIPLSPLIDAVFLLLIFFLVSTMIRKINRDIDIELPESTSAERMMPSDDNYVIGINEDGDVFFEGEETTIQSLHTEIREVGVKEPDVQIRLDVDRDTPTHRVIEVLDLCRFNGLVNVGIRTYDEFYNTR